MRESRTYGSVRGALSNGRPYRIRENDYRSESSGFVYLPETVRVSSKDLPTLGTEVSNLLPFSEESANHRFLSDEAHHCGGSNAAARSKYFPWRSHTEGFEARCDIRIHLRNKGVVD